jgi:hypothetical protein
MMKLNIYSMSTKTMPQYSFLKSNPFISKHLCSLRANPDFRFARSSPGGRAIKIKGLAAVRLTPFYILWHKKTSLTYKDAFTIVPLLVQTPFYPSERIDSL